MSWTLVTGGAKRLGAEICRTLAKEGYSVVIHYNTSAAEADEVVDQCRRLGVRAEKIQGDFSSTESTEEFLKRYGEQFPETAYLINNVGNFLIQSPLQTTCDQWQELFQTNLHAPFILIKGLAESIKKYKGSIINIGVAGVNHVVANTHRTAYNITKQGLLTLTKSLAKELAPYSVRVNMVSPGYLDIAVDLPQDVGTLPMKRAGTPLEVAQVVLFLLESRNAYITGQNIEVAGGICL